MTKKIIHLPIETDRTTIMNFQKEDITKEYIGWLNNRDLMRYSNQRFITHTELSSLEYVNSFEGTNNVLAKIIEKDSSLLIGTLTCYFDNNHKVADIGLLIGKQSRGFGSEVFNKITTVLKQTKNVRKITSGTIVRNHAMVRIIENAGLTLECIKPRQEIIDNQETDIHYYALYR